MTRTTGMLLALLLITGLAACSEQASPEKAHLLTEKMQTIKKAEAVDKVIEDAAALQRRTIDEQSE